MLNLSKEIIARRRELTDKLIKKNITSGEKQELEDILESYKPIAEKDGDYVLSFAIAGLLDILKQTKPSNS